MPKIQIKGQVLPSWVGHLLEASSIARDELIVELSQLGWTHEAISKGAGLTRERVRQIVVRHKGHLMSPVTSGMRLPIPPLLREKPKRVKREVSPAILERLIELQPLAQKVRSNSPRYRKEAEEYSALLNHAHQVEGVSLSKLAKDLGVTHAALRFRLTRYGYLKSEGLSNVYTPVIARNRYGRS